ncbi:hypothetical protein BJY04DRAFT_220333 [Aspergillus karnatakaensis]|uniref:uncharacterized protein n=1 Tax=Aspergillus karnatakaensis TaxID=1810916 RepID=UPI003CCD45BD
MNNTRAGESEQQLLVSRAQSPTVGTDVETARPSLESGQSPPVPDFDFPDGPQKLRNNARADVLTTSLQLVLGLLSVAFFVLAILAIRLDGKEISDYGDIVTQATQLGPTVFPIVFAAIVGALMRSYGLWKAQNCATLGLLEQLNGSTSFAGTVTTIIALRHLRFLTLAIMLLWVLSPLGGQSALRMLSQAPITLSGSSFVAYMDMNGTSGFEGSPAVYDTLGSTNAIYTSSLLASQESKDSPRDLWGWPKIPMLRTLPAAAAADNTTNPWRTYDSNDTIAFSSLVGLVLQGIPAGEDAEFAAETSYFDLDCRRLASNITQDSIFDAMGGKALIHNATYTFPTESPYTNFFVDSSYNFTTRFTSRNQASVNLFYVPRDETFGSRNIGTAALFNCTLSTVYVEVFILCKDAVCAVTRMRLSERDNDPEWTPWTDNNDGPSSWLAFTLLLTQFPFAIGPLAHDQAAPTDSYIYGDSKSFGRAYDRHWINANERDVSTRLATLFNTYWLASLAPFTVNQASALDPVNLAMRDQSWPPPPFNSSTARTSRTVNVYHANLVWICAFIAATVVLQFCAVASLFLKFITIAPDILGYVSSSTRDNEYTPLPRHGCTLSGADRARLLRDLKVQILDVDGEKGMGHIAFVSEALGGAERTLDRRREYD